MQSNVITRTPNWQTCPMLCNWTHIQDYDFKLAVTSMQFVARYYAYLVYIIMNWHA